MIRLDLSIGLDYLVADGPGDFILNIQAARTRLQHVVAENLEIHPGKAPPVNSVGPEGTRYMQVNAARGRLSIRYAATVDIDHHFEAPAAIWEVPVSLLPPAVLVYLYPSRYCQSDALRVVATREFGAMPHGYGRVLAIQQWVRGRTLFLGGSSNASTSALETMEEKVGVCRDFAHLMIALCRALNLPARFVSGIDYGADPALGAPDFHAYVEVFLGGRWYLFEPTGISPPTGLVRIGTGRDAADVSFATTFGAVSAAVPVIGIRAVEDARLGLDMPLHCMQAVSSMETEPGFA